MGGSLERVARRLWSAWVLSRSVRLCCHPLSFADCIESLTFCVCFGVYVSSFVSDRRSFFVSFLVGGFLFPVLFPRHSFLVFVILFGLFVDLSFSPLGLFCWFLCFGGVPWLLGSCLGSRLWLALVFGERGCVFLVWIRLIPASLSLCSCLFAPAGSLPRRRPHFLFLGSLRFSLCSYWSFAAILRYGSVLSIHRASHVSSLHPFCPRSCLSSVSLLSS